MSLPLTRRIAKTVLLTAAGAASVVGTAGAASAAELPTTNVGGLSHPDNTVGGTVGSTAAQSASTLSPMSSSPVSTASGTAASGVDAASRDTNQVAPETRNFAGNTADGVNQGLQGQAPNVRTQGLPTDNATQGTPAQSTPVQGTKGTPGKGFPANNVSTSKLLPGNPLGGVLSIGH